ncbi:hypothetical protein PN499_13980 [Kamptonema animale CS-326]|uniref:hypothetical protein n=1 Tax=Kamptonema animale TaxID=92934 RepID=UPI00232BB0C6|nr:hypothetical protein [Kamptonema animale]MDB9512296.1 hypothetical protein [Kamptonema animale CS-326]
MFAKSSATEDILTVLGIAIKLLVSHKIEPGLKKQAKLRSLPLNDGVGHRIAQSWQVLALTQRCSHSKTGVKILLTDAVML